MGPLRPSLIKIRRMVIFNLKNGVVGSFNIMFKLGVTIGELAEPVTLLKELYGVPGFESLGMVYLVLSVLVSIWDCVFFWGMTPLGSYRGPFG